MNHVPVRAEKPESAARQPGTHEGSDAFNLRLPQADKPLRFPGGAGIPSPLQDDVHHTKRN